MIVLDGIGGTKSTFNIRTEAGVAPEGIRIVVDPLKVSRGSIDAVLCAMGERIKKAWPELA